MIKHLWNRWIVNAWPRKAVALLAAVIIWALVSDSLTTTHTVRGVAVRMINLPPDKTVEGLLPNGLLKKRVSVTLEGKKGIVSDIQNSDIEVVINASNKKESFIAPIDKKTVQSVSPEFDLKGNINEVSGDDIFIKISNLVTVEIPVTITKPIGDPPRGYQFLDIWPKHLVQTVSGPEKEVAALKERGLVLTFDLNQIKKNELDELQEVHTTQMIDEVSFFVPNTWKMVAIPFRQGALESLNDPRAEFLRIDFLKQDLLPLQLKPPISLFFPVEYVKTLNPTEFYLSTNDLIERENGLTFFTPPLYARNVSRLFLDVVRDNMQLTIIAAPPEVNKELEWTVEFINQRALEDSYVQKAIEEIGEKDGALLQPALREDYLRQRFRNYIRSIVLYTSEDKKLRLNATLQANAIEVTLE